MNISELHQALLAILEDESKRVRYAEFLTKIFAIENLHFYDSVQRYRKLAADKRPEIARKIYERFIKENADNELGDIDFKMRDSISNLLDDAPIDLFDLLQQTAFLVMAHSTLKQFMEYQSDTLISTSPPSSGGIEEDQPTSPHTHSNIIRRLIDMIMSMITNVAKSHADTIPSESQSRSLEASW